MITHSIAIALAGSAMLCSYDPASGKPNPLGMRSYISIVSTGSTTRFIYDAFGNAAADGAAKREVDIAEPLKQARVLMRSSPAAYAALIGAEPDQRDDTYARLDPLMKCASFSALDTKRINAPDRVKVRFPLH